MTARAVAHKVNAGRVLGVELDSRGVYAFARPQSQQGLAERVAAHARQVGAAGAGPCGRDDGVAGVATEALQIGGLACRGLVEFHHALAQRCDIERFFHRHGQSGIGQGFIVVS